MQVSTNSSERPIPVLELMNSAHLEDNGGLNESQNEFSEISRGKRTVTW